MTITVDVAAETKDLTTVDTISSFLEIDPLDNEAILTQLIRQASDFIVSHTGREFARETVTELLSSPGDFRLVVTRTPVLSIIDVKFDGTSLSAAELSKIDIEDADAGFLWRTTPWTSTNISRHDLTLMKSRFSRRKWSIKYEAGYLLPGEANRTLPFDIEGVCIDLVRTWFKRRDRDGSIISEKIGSTSKTFTKSSIPEAVNDVLNNWTRNI